MQFNGKHAAVLGTFLISLGLLVSDLSDFSELLTPTRVGALIGLIGAQLGALYSDTTNPPASPGA